MNKVLDYNYEYAIGIDIYGNEITFKNDIRYNWQFL